MSPIVSFWQHLTLNIMKRKYKFIYEIFYFCLGILKNHILYLILICFNNPFQSILSKSGEQCIMMTAILFQKPRSLLFFPIRRWTQRNIKPFFFSLKKKKYNEINLVQTDSRNKWLECRKNLENNVLYPLKYDHHIVKKNK